MAEFQGGQQSGLLVPCAAMKLTPILFLAAATITFTACHSPHGSTAGSTVQLFNGRNLDGWQYVLADAAVPRDAVWTVNKGLLVCNGSPLGVLHTTEKFTNFRLVVEYRWAPGTDAGNNGILTRINGPARPLPRCAEVQLQQGNAGDVLGLQGMAVAAGQPRYFELKGHALAGDVAGVRKLVDAEHPVGEWNRVELLARGGTYTVWMNGQRVNEAAGVAVMPGAIGVQSEGGRIEFRKLALTRLGD